MEAILNFDWAVFGLFEKLWNPVLDVIMSVITYLGDDGIFWIVLGICLLIPKKTRKVGVYVLGGIAIAGFINNVCLKEIIQRPRPFNFDGWPEAFNYPNIVAKPDSWSFPSGHTSSSFGAAFALFLVTKKKYGIPALVLAFLIGCSRIYVHVHYPTDVIAGAVVGIIGGIIAFVLINKVWPVVYKKLQDKGILKFRQPADKAESEAK